MHEFRFKTTLMSQIHNCMSGFNFYQKSIRVLIFCSSSNYSVPPSFPPPSLAQTLFAKFKAFLFLTINYNDFTNFAEQNLRLQMLMNSWWKINRKIINIIFIPMHNRTKNLKQTKPQAKFVGWKQKKVFFFRLDV